MKFTLLVTLLSLAIQANCVDWQEPGNWALNCDLPGKDFTSARTSGSDCFNKCVDTSGCTHFTWTNYNGGTCWMKTGSRCKSEAVYKNGAVCGIRSGSCLGGVNEGDDDGIGGGDLNGGDGSALTYGELLWSDEFDYDGAPNDTDWWQRTGYGPNNENQYYMKDTNSKVSNGQLVLESRRQDYGGKRYTSGRIESYKKFRYGIFEMKAKLPRGRGIWPAFWMLSAKQPLNWPTDGEIDIMEHVGYSPNKIHATIHTGKYNHMIGSQIGKSYYLKDPYNTFHTYTVNWTPNYIKAYVDGNHYFTYEKRESSFSAWPFDTDFKIILNTAVGGDWGGAQGIDNNIFPATYTVEYVRQYQNGFVKV